MHGRLALALTMAMAMAAVLGALAKPLAAAAATAPVPGTEPIPVFRIFSDATGASHIERRLWSPQPDMAFGRTDIIQKFFFANASKVSVVAGAPGFAAPAHNTGGAHALIFMLQGSSSARTSDGNSQNFRAGDVILLDDTSGSGASLRIGPRGYLGLAVTLSSSGTVTLK